MAIKRRYNYIILIGVILCLLIMDLSQVYPKSVSNLELKGTIFTNSLKPIAIIKDSATGKINMYEVGEYVGGAKIVEVKRGEIILQEGESRYALVLPGGSVTQPEMIDFGIGKKEAGTFYISRAEVNNAILKATQIMHDVKVMPHFEKGMPQGIRLCSVKEGSIFEKAGVKSGDVVKSVNGMTLNTPYQIFQAYRKLKDEKNFKVDILRDNKSVDLSYIIE